MQRYLSFPNNHKFQLMLNIFLLMLNIFLLMLNIFLHHFIDLKFQYYIRVIRKVTAQTLVSILKEESEHQTHLCTITRQKEIWSVV